MVGMRFHEALKESIDLAGRDLTVAYAGGRERSRLAQGREI
jgi:hypothetical protein